MQTFITIRQIANGFLVATAADPRNSIRPMVAADHEETFYPSQEAILAAAPTILSDAIEAGVKAAAEWERRVPGQRRLSEGGAYDESDTLGSGGAAQQRVAGQSVGAD